MAILAIVEDDPDQSAWLAQVLNRAGYKCDLYANAEDFPRKVRENSVDLLILDWMLPERSGVELLRWLRHSIHAAMPVLLLTAKDHASDVVIGLDAGADDFLSKPADANILLARVRALLRRCGVQRDEGQQLLKSPYSINPAQRTIHLASVPITLTDREFDLAYYLFHRVDQMVSRDSLLREVWRMSPDIPSRSVDTYISRIRRKLELDGRHGWSLKTIYMHGYRLEGHKQVEA